MHRIPRCSTTILVLLLATTLAHASTPAKTPEDLIRSLIAAAQQGNADLFLAGLTANSRKAVGDSFTRQAAVQAAQQVLQQALDERFGKSAKTLVSPPSDVKSAISRLAGAEVLETKPGPAGSMRVRVKTSIKGPAGSVTTREDTLLARQEGGGWKLVLTFPPEKQPGSKTVLESFAKKVKDGEFKDRTAAMLALNNALLGSTEKRGISK